MLFLKITDWLFVDLNWVDFTKAAKLFQFFYLVWKLNCFGGNVSKATQLISDFVGIAEPANHFRVSAAYFLINC
jgi:hypothetical protein